MAKKKRTAKRSTKRRPSKRVAAKPKGGASGAFQGLPPSASQELSAAVQSTQGVTEPLPTPLEGRIDTRLQGVSGMRAEAVVIPAPVPITPTVYPDSPQGTIIVQNHVTINLQSEAFSRFANNFESLIGELHRSIEIAGELRDHLLSELRAGGEIITGPKPQRDLIDLFLVRPLKWLSEKSGLAMVNKLASDALAWLIKMLH